MKKVVVNPGVCGLETVITAEDEGDGVVIKAESKCPAVKKMIEAIEMPVEPYDVCFLKPGQGPVYEAAVNLLHASCPVPSAVIKAIEAEASLALPKDVSMRFEG